ncbi:MAG: hypothetical protein E4H36_08110 [Spirochaetales bacterium]|nr:MAG: hypothetical protein E4H36_08110 [Spirochaetales bacterium]
MNKLFSFFKSVKLAIVLISIITATSILATLVPQNKDMAFYYHTYSPFFNWLIINTRFYKFFTSILFFIPAGLFFINLSTCTVDRLVRQLKKKGKKKFGPDILHVGLLVLLIGAVFTFAGKREGYMTLASGDKMGLPGGYLLTLKSFTFLTYENGSPKDWISTVDVEKEGKKLSMLFP